MAVTWKAICKVDKQCRTSMKNVWAIGDIIGGNASSKASAQGEMVVK